MGDQNKRVFRAKTAGRELLANTRPWTRLREYLVPTQGAVAGPSTPRSNARDPSWRSCRVQPFAGVARLQDFEAESRPVREASCSQRGLTAATKEG